MASGKIQIVVSKDDKKFSQTVNNVVAVSDIINTSTIIPAPPDYEGDWNGWDAYAEEKYAAFGNAIAAILGGTHLETRYIEQRNLPIS